MKATALLEHQHRDLEQLFEEFEGTDDFEKKLAVFEQLALSLVAHDTIEREMFYPACRREVDDEDVLGEALVEHGVIAFCLYRADANRDEDEMDHYVKVLKDTIERHVEEEESELLPVANRDFDGKLLDTLGHQMEVRFEQVMQTGDFRTPLREVLEEVLERETPLEPSEFLREEFGYVEAAADTLEDLASAAGKQVPSARHARLEPDEDEERIQTLAEKAAHMDIPVDPGEIGAEPIGTEQEPSVASKTRASKDKAAGGKRLKHGPTRAHRTHSRPG